MSIRPKQTRRERDGQFSNHPSLNNLPKEERGSTIPSKKNQPNRRNIKNISPKRPKALSAAQRAEMMKMHLRTDDMKDEIIEYTVDHPNRVSVRMEYLMQTTKARVNDREFMNTLYQRLVAEENKDLAGQTRVREWMEKDRVKNLVVNGKMDPPPDMKELEHHPVYRINKLTKRMMEWSSHFHSQGAPLPEITPVEPYEFDGDQFFRHLHQNGTYWIPEEERLAEEEKMAGKIARARLRYLEKKYHNEQREKLMIQLRSAHPSDEDIVKKPYESKERFESRRRKFRIARVKSQLFKETEKQAHVFRRKRLILERQERIRKEKAEQRKRERDIIFLGDRDQERREYLNRFKDKAASKTVVHYQLDGALQESEYVLAVPKTSKSASGKSIRSFESPSNLHTSSSFDKLREAFRVDGGYSLSKFQPAVNPVFQKYIQLAETMDELTENSKDFTDMYTREQTHVDQYILQLRRANMPIAEPPDS